MLLFLFFFFFFFLPATRVTIFTGKSVKHEIDFIMGKVNNAINIFLSSSPLQSL